MQCRQALSLGRPVSTVSACVGGRAQAIGALMKDTQRLREEREAFAKKRRTYAGYSRDEMTPARSVSTGLDGIGGGASSLRRSVRPGTWHARMRACSVDVVPLNPAHCDARYPCQFGVWHARMCACSTALMSCF